MFNLKSLSATIIKYYIIQNEKISNIKLVLFRFFNFNPTFLH